MIDRWLRVRVSLAKISLVLEIYRWLVRALSGLPVEDGWMIMFARVGMEALVVVWR